MERAAVWVTGIGAVTPGGWGAEQTWSSVVEGRSAVGELRRFPIFDAGTRVAATVPGREFVAPAESHAVEFGLAAAREALGQAGLAGAAAGLPGEVDALVLATHGERPLPVPGQDVPNFRVDTIAGAISAGVGAARSSVVWAACAGGGLAVVAGTELVRSGAAEVALVGGTDSLLREVDFFSFLSLYAMTTRDCAPAEASCPFDSRRDGFVLAEGAGFLVLEAAAHARARGADPLAVVAGVGSAQNAYHMIASPPDARGPEYAIRRALTDAGADAAAVDYVNAHGTSTRDNDWCETLALKQALGPAARTVPISSSKSVLGHSMAAAGAIETVLCVQALRDGVIPPTLNLSEPDPNCDLDYVPHEARNSPLATVLNNSFGFGGHNAAVVLGRRP